MDTQTHSYAKSYLQLIPTGKEKLVFCNKKNCVHQPHLSKSMFRKNWSTQNELYICICFGVTLFCFVLFEHFNDMFYNTFVLLSKSNRHFISFATFLPNCNIYPSFSLLLTLCYKFPLSPSSLWPLFLQIVITWINVFV